MTHDAPAYGLWLPVALNSLVFIMFAFSFGKPQSPRDWRSFGAFSAFVVALFTEQAEARQAFGDGYVRHAARVPGWFPHLQRAEAEPGLG